MRNAVLIACAWKGTLVLMAAVGLCAALRKASAAARSLVWTVAFSALLLLPLLSRLTPEWSAPVPRAIGAELEPEPMIQPSTVRPGPDWAQWIWLLGAAGVFARFAVGTARIWRRTHRGKPISFPAAIGGAKLIDSGPGVMPMTWGVFHPVILLPSEAPAWPAERLRAVLLHEAAHIARRDWLTLAMSELALSLYWFHPLAWWAASRMRRDREQACDDRVLAAGIAPTDYAGELVEIARGRAGRLLAAPAMARGSNLESRLRAILNPNVRRRSVTVKTAAVTAAAAILILTPLASLRLRAQGSGLNGVVYDQSGGVVPQATVSVLNLDTKLTQTRVSDDAGAYSFSSLPAGTYQLTVAHPGFAVYARKDVLLRRSWMLFYRSARYRRR